MADLEQEHADMWLSPNEEELAELAAAKKHLADVEARARLCVCAGAAKTFLFFIPQRAARSTAVTGVLSRNATTII